MWACDQHCEISGTNPFPGLRSYCRAKERCWDEDTLLWDEICSHSGKRQKSPRETCDTCDQKGVGYV